MKTVAQIVAQAMYESHGFKKPWDHPDTVRLWHPVKLAEARAAIDAYHKFIRDASDPKKIRQGVA